MSVPAKHHKEVMIHECGVAVTSWRSLVLNPAIIGDLRQVDRLAWVPPPFNLVIVCIEMGVRILDDEGVEHRHRGGTRQLNVLLMLLVVLLSLLLLLSKAPLPSLNCNRAPV